MSPVRLELEQDPVDGVRRALAWTAGILPAGPPPSRRRDDAGWKPAVRVYIFRTATAIRSALGA